MACAELSPTRRIRRVSKPARKCRQVHQPIESRDVVVPVWCQDVLTRKVREPTTRHHALQRRRSRHMQ